MKYLRDWAPLLVSGLALFVSVFALLIDWRVFILSKESVAIRRSSSLPTLSVSYASQSETLEMLVRFELRFENYSTGPVSIVNLQCEVGPVPWRDAEVIGRILLPDSCHFLEIGPNGERPIVGPVNVPPQSSFGVVLEIRYPPGRKTADALREYLQGNDFNDEAFLLFLAESGTDFFGTEFPYPYDYLQMTFGRNLCLGGSARVEAQTLLGASLEFDSDFYVGPMVPAVSCGDNDRAVIAFSSVPYNRNHWNYKVGPLDLHYWERYEVK